MHKPHLLKKKKKKRLSSHLFKIHRKKKQQIKANEMAPLPRKLIFSCNVLNKNCISFKKGHAFSSLGDFAYELNYKRCNKMEAARN